MSDHVITYDEFNTYLNIKAMPLEKYGIELRFEHSSTIPGNNPYDDYAEWFAILNDKPVINGSEITGVEAENIIDWMKEAAEIAFESGFRDGYVKASLAKEDVE